MTRNRLDRHPDYTRKDSLWYDFSVMIQPLLFGKLSLYSLLMTLGAALGLAISIWRVKDNKFTYTKLGMAQLLGALVGARISYGVQNWTYFRSHLLELPQVWSGGLTWSGALVGALAVLVGIHLFWNQPFMQMLDLYLPMWGTAAAVMWLAGWEAGVGYGPQTDAWFGIPVWDLYGQVSNRWPLPILGASLSAAWTACCCVHPLRRFPFLQSGQRGLIGLDGLLLINGGLSVMKVDPAPRFGGIRWETLLSGGFFLIVASMVFWIRKENKMKKLLLDADQAIDTLVEFIRNTVKDAGFEKVVLGVSGGVDSALSAFLSVKALGPENVLLLRLPYQTSSPDSMEHAQLVIDQTRAKSATYQITNPVDAVLKDFPEADRVRKGNVMARMRMIYLYDQSAAFSGLVVGTGNKTEILLGYSTLHGDGAADFNPLADLYKAQVKQLAAAIGVPQDIIEKSPSADLWVGQTDEEELGFSYDDVDRLLYDLVEEGRSTQKCLEAGFEQEFVNRVTRRIKTYRYKSTQPLSGSVGQYPVAELEDLPVFSE